MNNKILLAVIIVIVVIALVVGGMMLSNQPAENTNLDLVKAEENVKNIKSDVYSISLVGTEISNDPELMGEMVSYVYDFNLEDYGIDSEKIASNNGMLEFNMYKTDENSFVIVKAKDEYKSELEAEFDTYFKDKTSVVKEEVNGYLVYLDTKDNVKALEIVKTKGYQPLFADLMKLDSSTLNLVGLVEDDLAEYSVYLPAFMISSEQYMIVKPAEGKEETVKTLIEDYFTKEEEKWSTYLPDQYALMQNRTTAQVGDYLVYIVSKDNTKVLDTIKSSVKE